VGTAKVSRSVGGVYVSRWAQAGMNASLAHVATVANVPVVSIVEISRAAVGGVDQTGLLDRSGPIPAFPKPTERAQPAAVEDQRRSPGRQELRDHGAGHDRGARRGRCARAHHHQPTAAGRTLSTLVRVILATAPVTGVAIGLQWLVATTRPATRPAGCRRRCVSLASLSASSCHLFTMACRPPRDALFSVRSAARFLQF
jgi:hypothetical protein